ncbi:reverse transcriptase domain-containing protein, partial [Tanacetum coccineum]
MHHALRPKVHNGKNNKVQILLADDAQRRTEHHQKINGIDISGPFPKAQGKVKFLIIAIDYFIKWVQAKAVATIMGNQVKKFVWDNIVCRFGLPGEIKSDNRKRFRDNPFKDCLGEGIKARLGEDNINWVEEVPHVLWVKIGMPSLRCAEVNQAENDEELLLNLDILEERREKLFLTPIPFPPPPLHWGGMVCEAKSKAKMEKYYNARVRNTAFRPGDFVYRNNEASNAKNSRNLGPKWEGPYEVVEALGRGAYKLRHGSGDILPRTWNVKDLKNVIFKFPS